MIVGQAGSPWRIRLRRGRDKRETQGNSPNGRPVY
jgi:hypothetical protein